MNNMGFLWKRREGANAYAEAYSILITVFFVLITFVKPHPFYMGRMIPLHLFFSAIAVFAVVLINRHPGIPVKMLPYFVPSAIAVFKTISTIIAGGDPIHFLALFICSAIAIIYIDLFGLIIYIILVNALTSAVIFIFKFPLAGAGLGFNSLLSQYIIFNLFNIILCYTCAFSAQQFEKAEKRSNSFEVIMRTTPSFMVIIDDDARLKYISQSFADWLQIPNRDYAINLPFFDLLKSGGMKNSLQNILEIDDYIADNEYMLSPGDKDYWFMMRSSPFVRGKVGRFMELYDITQIVEAKNKAEIESTKKDYFLANMSHAIRTPMNAIIGTADLLALTDLNEEQQAYTFAIKNASMSLLNIINDILDFSKIQSRSIELQKGRFKFSNLINDTVNVISIRTRNPNVAFTVTIPKDMPQNLLGDKIRIKQILINVLGNAVKFTASGNVSLTCSSERLQENKIRINFEVKDTGVGIKKDDLKKLFNEFEQFDTLENSYAQGTGLGLAISNKLVQAMGGSFIVESTYGKGSVFSFYIICEAVNDRPMAFLDDPGLYNVICYEPNPYYSNTLSKMFEDFGVTHKIISERKSFGQELLQTAYTHIFFDNSTIDIVTQNCDIANGKSKLVIMKDIRGRYVYKDLSQNVKYVNKPVLTKTLAKILTGLYFHAQSYSADDKRPGAFTTRDVKALIVDDNTVNLYVAEGLLKKYNIDVVRATGGADAIRKAAEENFDIILMDHMMPDIDGIDATKAIREMGGDIGSVPIIALSANATTGARELFLSSGMNDFISKPIDIKRLNQILLNYIDKNKIIKIK